MFILRRWKWLNKRTIKQGFIDGNLKNKLNLIRFRINLTVENTFAWINLFIMSLSTNI